MRNAARDRGEATKKVMRSVVMNRACRRLCASVHAWERALLSEGVSVSKRVTGTVHACVIAIV